MKLYFSPLACSLATRITFYEAAATLDVEIDVSYIEVDPKTKQTEEGHDFRALHGLGLVPALEIEPGQILTENAAILQFVAARYPEARLAPQDPWGRAQLQQWLCFIGTELHKTIYVPLLDRTAPPEVKAYALSKAALRLGWLAQHLQGREFLLDHFTVADAYLFAVLNWSSVTPVDLKPWPAVHDYYTRLHRRPTIARAFAEERERYLREVARHQQSRALGEVTSARPGQSVP